VFAYLCNKLNLSMTKSTVLLFSCLFLAGVAAAQYAEKYSEARIFLEGRSIGEIARLGIEVEHAMPDQGRSMTAMLSEKELNDLKNAGFSVEILIDDVAAHVAEHYANRETTQRSAGCQTSAYDYWPTPDNFEYGTMAGFHRYDEILETLDSMHAKFPHLITMRKVVSDTIVTAEGRPIWYVKISDNPDQSESDEAELLFTSLHHAREPNGMSQLLFFMWYLLENYDNDERVRHILDNEAIYFVPCVNPDGYLWNEFVSPNGGGGWRKNRRDNGDNTRGVDLNRNYGYEWGIDDEGSSPNPGSNTYRGTAPFSEPETRTLRDFHLQHDFVFTQNYHTRGDLLIYPWGYSDQLADSAFYYLGKLMTRENNYSVGTCLEVLAYRVNGTSDDWMYGSAGSMAFTPEVGTPDGGFWPPFENILPNNKRCMWQNMATVLSALHFAVATDISPNGIAAQNTSIDVKLQRYGFRNGDFTLSMEPVSNNIVSVSPPQIFTLDQYEESIKTLQLSLSPGVQSGDIVTWIQALSNGFFTQRDTVRKVYVGNQATTLFENDCSTNAGWQGEWDASTEYFVSPPASMTDSPGSAYVPFAFNQIVLDELIDIPADALRPQLRFFARWALEEDRDYVKLILSGNNGISKVACGLYSEPGSLDQGDGEPVYDGIQNGWVEECINLDEFAGFTVQMSFLLASNGAFELDGFYFDDLRFSYFDPVSNTQIVRPAKGAQPLYCNPNPADQFTIIEWEPSLAETDTKMLIINAQGQQVRSVDIVNTSATKHQLDTSSLPSGIYCACFEQAGKRTAYVKIAVQH
jgi:carboxypeptidase T